MGAPAQKFGLAFMSADVTLYFASGPATDTPRLVIGQRLYYPAALQKA
jgi:hypothetical protein